MNRGPTGMKWNECGTNVELQEEEGTSRSYGRDPVSWHRICKLEIHPENSTFVKCSSPTLYL